MLNRTLPPRFPDAPTVRLTLSGVQRIAPDPNDQSDWCVGTAPLQWDVSFTDRLMLRVRSLFIRPPSLPAIDPADSKPVRVKAA